MLCFAGWMSAAAPVCAQDAQTREQEARALFEAGRLAFSAGEFVRALDYLERAYALAPRPSILNNAAESAAAAGQLERAVELFERLAETGDANDVSTAQTRLSELRARIARRGPIETGSPEPEPQAVVETTQPVTPTTSGGSDAGAWVIFGSGSALVVGGAVLLIVAAVDTSCVSSPGGCVADPDAPRWAEVSDAYERAPILQGVGVALLGVGAVGAAVGLGWALSGSSDDDASVTLRVLPGSVALSGAWR